MCFLIAKNVKLVDECERKKTIDALCKKTYIFISSLVLIFYILSFYLTNFFETVLCFVNIFIIYLPHVFITS